MSPDEKFVVDRESVLTELESNLVKNLTESDRTKVSEIEELLRAEQSTKEADETISLLPSLLVSML
jgi:Zn-dependent M16 (insulinase) family peptidase